MADTTMNAETPVADAEAAAEALARVKTEIGKAVFGQEKVIELSLAAVLAGGHALLIGAPGLAKTRLVEAMGTALGLANQRIQFTPDLMPSDILGSEVLNEGPDGERSFRFIKGPVFTQLLMADEINRASPRTQSALLQAMQEKHVTVAGARHDLPAPFHVLATQNPIEQEGTYPLPEAQLDRFLLKVDVSYPDLDTERRILIETTRGAEAPVKAALSPAELMKIQALVRQMPVGEKLVATILNLIREARPEQTSDARVKRLVDWGPSPRAGQALMLAARARALLRGRLAPSMEDIEALAEPCLGHRMAMRYDPTGDAPKLSDLINDLVRKAA
ncbi:MoxR family ATPase [Hyphomonas sp. WL0036]|uniref:AAA family ATPase n=1 Tax=Hyphomonas sediminis TaxID=2866160 RepID=UPI001C800B83|nr:MoxR family ATPase [Hyphomonas sediminis]MBY9065678.1 MoxR family ATPase [Hyphomonas sediminis]